MAGAWGGWGRAWPGCERIFIVSMPARMARGLPLSVPACYRVRVAVRAKVRAGVGAGVRVRVRVRVRDVEEGDLVHAARRRDVLHDLLLARVRAHPAKGKAQACVSSKACLRSAAGGSGLLGVC